MEKIIQCDVIELFILWSDNVLKQVQYILNIQISSGNWADEKTIINFH